MTGIEKKQPHSQFVETGRSAYRMGIWVSGNLYHEQPYRDLWEKGWRLERRKAEGVRNATTPGRTDQGEQAGQGFQRKPRLSKPTERKPGVKPAPRQEGVNADRLVARFNRRYRTAV